MPDEIFALEHPDLEQVKLECWNNLQGKNNAGVPIDVSRKDKR